MRTIRIFLALAILSLAAGACSSPAGLDCDQSGAACVRGGVGANI